MPFRAVLMAAACASYTRSQISIWSRGISESGRAKVYSGISKMVILFFRKTYSCHIAVIAVKSTSAINQHEVILLKFAICSTPVRKRAVRFELIVRVVPTQDAKGKKGNLRPNSVMESVACKPAAVRASRTRLRASDSRMPMYILLRAALMESTVT